MTKILIVDDDTVLAHLYKSAFENEGFEVDIATDGEEGLAKAKADRPSFILSDIMMPRVDGLEMLKNLKKDKKTKTVPIIVMTNLKDEENAKIALSEGAIKVIIKEDNDPKSVVSFVKEALKSDTGGN